MCTLLRRGQCRSLQVTAILRCFQVLLVQTSSAQGLQTPEPFIVIVFGGAGLWPGCPGRQVPRDPGSSSPVRHPCSQSPRLAVKCQEVAGLGGLPGGGDPPDSPMKAPTTSGPLADPPAGEGGRAAGVTARPRSGREPPWLVVFCGALSQNLGGRCAPALFSTLMRGVRPGSVLLSPS